MVTAGTTTEANGLIFDSLLTISPLLSTNVIGHTKVNRLEFIADRCPSLQVDALKLAITELRNTNTLHVSRYINLVRKLNEAVKFGAPGSASVSSDLLTVDKAWADNQMLKAKQQTDLLEGELKNYKRNSIKESIRVSLLLTANCLSDRKRSMLGFSF